MQQTKLLSACKNSTPRWDIHVNQDVDDDSNISHHSINDKNTLNYRRTDEQHLDCKNESGKKDEQHITLRNVGIQTRFEDAKTCALVTVSTNYLVYNVHCFYCDVSFAMRDCEKFILHIQKNHRYTDDTFYDCSFNFENESSNEVQVKPNETTEKVFEYQNVIMCNQTQMESKYLDTDENELSDDLIISEVESSKSQMDVQLEEEWLDDEIEFPEIVITDCTKVFTTNSCEDATESIDSEETLDTFAVEPKEKKRKLNAENHELSVETSDAALICGLLDLLESYPVLWFFQLYKSISYVQALLDLLKKFNKKFQLEITEADMHQSIQKIGLWYQSICEKELLDQLVQPQREYFQKCSKFFPDKANGISCVHCRRLMPDHLQYFAHEKFHDEVDNSNSKIFGIAKNQINNYLETRYSIDRKVHLYECQVCNQQFSKRSVYFDHIKAHINIRDFVCDICGATFVRQQGLRNHKHRHFGSLKCLCKICNKTFNDAQILSMHRQRYHRPIEGTIEEIEANLLKSKNGKRSRGSTKYKTRFDPKTNKQRWVCHFCDKDYQYYGGLYKHFTLFHKDQWVPETAGKKPNELPKNFRVKRKRAYVLKINNEETV